MELEKLQKIIAEVLNVDAQEVTMDTTFVEDLGADSLDIFQIIMGIEEEFDIEMPNEDVEHIVTVGDAVEEIKKSKKYCKYIDIIGVVLDENEEYTLEEVDEAINDFLEREV